MLFTSLRYAAFLTVVVVFNWALPRRYRPLLLLVASYVFYAFWDVRLMALLGLATVVTWAVVQVLPGADGRRRTMLTAIAVATSVGVLAVFKVLEALRGGGAAGDLAAGGGLSFTVPVGLSFFTFQAISYVVDVHRREIEPSRSLIDVALYISFFPHLLAGPIVRAKKLIPAFHSVPHTPNAVQWVEGCELILVGVFKKVVLSNPLIDRLFTLSGNTSSLGIVNVVVGLAGGVLAAYFDITGYVDIARGSAKLLGIDMQRNALTPLLRSTGFADFWRRWQLTLMMWFRDYVYKPIRGDGRSAARETLALFASFAVLGLWHGASWNWVLWGAVSGLIIVAERTLQTRRAARRRELRRSARAAARSRGKRPRPLPPPSKIGQLLTAFLLVAVTLPLIAAPSLARSFDYYRLIVQPHIGVVDWDLIMLTAIAIVGLFALDHREQRREAQAGRRDPLTPPRALAFGVLVLGIVVFSGASSQPFLYFRF